MHDDKSLSKRYKSNKKEDYSILVNTNSNVIFTIIEVFIINYIMNYVIDITTCMYICI